MNYSEIVSAVKDFSDRKGSSVSDNIDIFIYMTESKINRMLKTRRQTRRVYTNVSTDDGEEWYSLPSDYNGVRSIQFNTGAPDTDGSYPILMYDVPYSLLTKYETQDSKRNIYYTILNNQIKLLKPLPADGTIEMVYYMKIPHLNTDNPNNWASDDFPDIYICGIMNEIELFIKNYDAAKVWSDRLTSIMDSLHQLDSIEKYPGPIQIRTYGER